MTVRLAALAVLVSGCSILFMEKPPDRVDATYPVCTESAAAPIADAAFAALAGLIGFAIWWDHQEYGDSIPDDERNVMIGSGALLALHTTSAVLGARWISRCSARRNQWARQELRYHRPSDPRPSASPPDVPPPRRPRGGEGEPCYPNGTCNRGFTCDLGKATCRSAAP